MTIFNYWLKWQNDNLLPEAVLGENHSLFMYVKAYKNLDIIHSNEDGALFIDTDIDITIIGR